SNHHLGTMLGLLAAAYEMNHFKDEYQQKVLANAKILAKGLWDCGMDVAGDPANDFTETHQVILNVGYGRGPEIAAELEANNIICNYQAAPFDEGFTASGALRLGAAEMTRFGMEKDDFRQVAQLIADVVKNRKQVKEQVSVLRKKFREIRFCFKGEEYDDLLNVLHGLI
ncbi:MAG: glycine cleavage system protein T, partial [Gammaproteobacteria bacterium]